MILEHQPCVGHVKINARGDATETPSARRISTTETRRHRESKRDSTTEAQRHREDNESFSVSLCLGGCPSLCLRGFVARVNPTRRLLPRRYRTGSSLLTGTSTTETRRHRESKERFNDKG